MLFFLSRSSPAIDEIEGVLYVGSYDSYLYSLYLDTGSLKWKYKTNGPIASSPG